MIVICHHCQIPVEILEINCAIFKDTFTNSTNDPINYNKYI